MLVNDLSFEIYYQASILPIYRIVYTITITLLTNVTFRLFLCRIKVKKKKKGNQSRKQCMVYFIKMASVIAVLSLLQHFCSFKNSYSPGSLSGLIREKFFSKSFLSLSTIWQKFPSRELLSLCFSKCFSPGKVTHFIFFHASSNAQVTSNAVF